MAKCIEVIPNRICKKKVPTGKFVKCIEYQAVDNNGEIHACSYVSLDMKWVKPQIGPLKNTWYEVSMDHDGSLVLKDVDSKLHELVVEMVANMAIESVLAY